MINDNMSATIVIDGLRFRAFHGVLEQERKIGNVFEVSVSLKYPRALKALESDDVADTLNYAEAISIIRSVMSEPSALLEHVAGRIHKALIDAFPGIESGRIIVSKLAPPVAAELAAARFILEF